MHASFKSQHTFQMWLPTGSLTSDQQPPGNKVVGSESCVWDIKIYKKFSVMK